MVRVALVGLLVASLAPLGSLAAVLQENAALVEQPISANAGWDYADCGASHRWPFKIHWFILTFP